MRFSNLRAGRHVTQSAGGPSFLDSQAPKDPPLFTIVAEPHLSLDHQAVASSNRPIRVFVSTFSVYAVYMRRRSFFHLTSGALPASFYMLCAKTLVVHSSILNFRFKDTQCPTTSPYMIKLTPDIRIVRRVNNR